VFPIDTIRQADVDLRFASDPGSGLTVVALPDGGLAARLYGVATETIGPAGTHEARYTICVG
jgi:hypothetical protein